MHQKEREIYLIDYLLSERGMQFDREDYSFDLYRALVNTRAPDPIDEAYLEVEDEYLCQITKDKGIVKLEPNSSKIVVWQGDITQLEADAIVNAANEQMLGCFIPGHQCIDNAIHTFAGVRLRLACAKAMSAQKKLEPIGRVKVTPAYNLPSEYVFHTVGPMVKRELTARHEKLLKMCYLSCLKKAEQMHLKSIAFCCISTGVFQFPKESAARIAVETVNEFMCHAVSLKQVIFNVFKNEDREIYERLTGDIK